MGEQNKKPTGFITQKQAKALAKVANENNVVFKYEVNGVTIHVIPNVAKHLDGDDGIRL